MIKRTTIIEIITVLNIILFLYTGIAKIMDYSVFKEQLTDSPILSWAATPVAVLLPVVEFAIVLMLVIPRWRLKGLYSVLMLMSLFAIYTISLIVIRKEITCSCGGVVGQLSWKQHIVFNCAFIAIDLWAIRLLRKEKKALSKDWNEVIGYRVSHG